MPRSIYVFVPWILLALLLAGCEATPEYAATIEDFRDIGSWKVMDYTIGQSNPLLGGAHRGGDDRYSRKVYFHPGVAPSQGSFPVGTIILKETFTWVDGERYFSPTDGVLAMVKRGRDFNPEGGGWEWIALTPDRRHILSRGGSRMGMCNVCHRYADTQDGGSDFVFPAPTEFVYDGRDFHTYRRWTMIDQLSGPDPFLTAVRDVHDSLVTRRVFKKQLLANPDTDSLGYPAGTIFLKEILRRGYVTGILARVKRGGPFNRERGGWDWFVIDPASFIIRDRGAETASGACGKCHETAVKAGTGRDHVFPHPGDPFNH